MTRSNRSTAARQLGKQVARMVERHVERMGRTTPAPRRHPRRTLRQATDEFQRRFVLAALENHRSGDRWNISATAKELQISRNLLYGLIERFRLS